MGVDEDRVRVLPKQIVLLGHDLLPGGILGRVTIPSGPLDQLVEAFVFPVSFLPELERIASVDENRNAELGARRPDRSQPRIVDRNPLSTAVRRVHAEALVDLEPSGPVGHVFGQPRGRSLGPAGLVDAPRRDVGEDDEPPRGGCLRSRDRILQIVGGVQIECRRAVLVLDPTEAPARQVDQDCHVQLVHLRHQLLEVLVATHAKLVVVDVDEWEARPRHRVLGYHER